MAVHFAHGAETLLRDALRRATASAPGKKRKKRGLSLKFARWRCVRVKRSAKGPFSPLFFLFLSRHIDPADLPRDPKQRAFSTQRIEGQVNECQPGQGGGKKPEQGDQVHQRAQKAEPAPTQLRSGA